MAKFLTTRDTASEIEKIINNAQNRLVLISPFVKIPETLLQNLKVADSRKVKITLVYGKAELNPDERKKLEQLNNLSLYFLENLHAKCFFNEEYMVITSMNLYDFSEQNNREMGVLVSSKDDKDVFSEAVNEAKLMVYISEKEDLRRPKTKSYSDKTKQNGYCIRCRKEIPYDLNRPLCLDCFRVWKKWGDTNYEEYYCHLCSKTKLTTFEKPLCYSCYRKSLI